MLPVCPRCGFELQPIDGSPPPFCAHCGLPQLRVSPDAQAYASPQDAAAQTPHAEIDPGSRTDWPKALKLISVAALIGVIPPAALPGALSSGALGGPTLLLTPVLSLGVVSLYHRSRPRRHVHASIGARMGATLGLVMGGGVALLTGIAGFVMRYNYHSHTVDDAIQQGTNQLLARLADTGPVPPEILGFVQSPQFRAGSFLLSHVFFALLLVFIGAVCGWIAGSMLNARRERSVGL
jgi:hypothetical protein